MAILGPCLAGIYPKLVIKILEISGGKENLKENIFVPFSKAVGMEFLKIYLA